MINILKKPAAALLAAFLSASAAHAGDILAIKSDDIEPYNLALKGAKKALRERGYAGTVDTFDLAGEPARWRAVLERIRENRPRVIMTFGSFATLLTKNEIRDIPVVFSTVLNPEESGIISSSGGNITGASLDVPVTVQFSYILGVVPSAKKIGVLYNPGETGTVVEKAKKAAGDMDLSLIAEAVRDEADLPRAIDRLFGKIDVLWSVADSTVFSPPAAQQIIVEAIKHRLPFMGPSPAFVKGGALLSVKWDDEDIGRQAGEMAHSVLSGRDASTIPVSTPEKLSLSINLKTAGAIKLPVPGKVLKNAEVFR